MLLSLRVRGFKSLHDLQVELAPLVVVFGPNAAGKSNLLESLVLLSRLVQERTLAEAFDGGIRGYPVEAFSFREGGVEGLIARDGVTLALEARLGAPAKAALGYRVEVGIRPTTGELSAVDEQLGRIGRDGEFTGNSAIERVETDKGPRMRIRRKAKGSHPFEEPVGLGHTQASNRQYAGGDRYPDFDTLREEVGAWRIVYLDPREAMRQPQPPREVDDIGERGEHLVPFLHRLNANEQHRKYFKAIVRAVKAVIPSIEDVQTELVNARGELELKVLQGGVWLSSRVLSEGTLRVLALCAMAANPFHRGLIAFEEPENGVHPHRIDAITRILVGTSRQRQVVVTTHSPLVVGEVLRLLRAGDLTPADLKILICSGGPDGTKIRPFEPSGPLFESNEVGEALIAPDDAARVAAALSMGWLDG